MPNEPLFQDPVEVKLVRHRALDKNAAIPGWVEFDFYDVLVISESLSYRNSAKTLQVGIIGIHAGANFMETNELKTFVYAHRQWIAEEAKRQHGSASTKPHNDVPTHEEMVAALTKKEKPEESE